MENNIADRRAHKRAEALWKSDFMQYTPKRLRILIAELAEMKQLPVDNTKLQQEKSRDVLIQAASHLIDSLKATYTTIDSRASFGYFLVAMDYLKTKGLWRNNP